MSGASPAIVRRENRLRTASEFSLVYRTGRRARTSSVVAIAARKGSGVARVGFATSRKLGGAVVRNRARRRLRAAVGPLVGSLPAGSLLVLQATPETAKVDFQKLGDHVRAALASAGASNA